MKMTSLATMLLLFATIQTNANTSIRVNEPKDMLIPEDCIVKNVGVSTLTTNRNNVIVFSIVCENNKVYMIYRPLDRLEKYFNINELNGSKGSFLK